MNAWICEHVTTYSLPYETSSEIALVCEQFMLENDIKMYV